MLAAQCIHLPEHELQLRSSLQSRASASPWRATDYLACNKPTSAIPHLLCSTTLKSPYTRHKAKSKYRSRIWLERASQKQSSDTHKTPCDRVKRCRERKINVKASERVNVDRGLERPMRVSEVNTERAPERRCEGGGGGGRKILEKTRQTNGIVRHDSHLRKSGDPAGD
ncbi:hypothetical protein PR048_000199 [Dryococelus australis]|uniref:Uncharacterized protein n=1 Tax=Dryococelus australis TaxID=614101 RepID=A0ABQ9IEJ7_9NEOP|nr:hypothetical protein PR048_000199 [Dryococelus australis]